ncbi:MAG: hypothetical protein IKD83_04785 [Firmicutes bacterium]|nr:hypothetical protein [Bacillota bacterium]
MEKYGNISLFFAGSFFDEIQKPTEYRRFASAFVVLYGVQKKERHGDKFMPKMVFLGEFGPSSTQVIHRQKCSFLGLSARLKRVFWDSRFYFCLYLLMGNIKNFDNELFYAKIYKSEIQRKF